MLTQFTMNEVQTIVESSHDGIIVIDKNARILLSNSDGRRILGLPEQVIGKKITDFIPHSDLIRILQTGKKEIGDIATVLNRKLVINRLPLIDKGEVIGVVSSFREISDIQKMELKIRQRLHQSGLEAKYQLKDIVGSSAAITSCKKLAEQFGKSDATVMILGDSGTGKELFAQGIHLCSSRAKGPFVAVNCAALPDSLLESELFGYEEGTFTGAMKGGKMGLFELAHGGTIFLDEVGEMSLRIQAMLLRIIEERQLRRIGGQKVIPLDVRIMVATNRHLEKMIQEGAFRKDLFYRLNVLSLELPLLRDRLSDLPELVESIIEELNEHFDYKVTGVSPRVLDIFAHYGWPGNVRELRNVLERMMLMAEGPMLTEKDAMFLVRKIPSIEPENHADIGEAERLTILDALRAANGNKTHAAQYLGVNRSTLWRKMKKLHI